MEDFLKYYNLENAYFDEICKKYEKTKKLTAFEFFSIIIWKSNRPKTIIAKSLKENYKSESIEKSVTKFIEEFNDCSSDEIKFYHLLKINGIGLAMASAILSILFPKKYTIYDFRVCKHEKLKDYYKLANMDKTNKNLFSKYEQFVKAVVETVPEYTAMRDKDRFLWGKSFKEQLENNINENFK